MRDLYSREDKYEVLQTDRLYCCRCCEQQQVILK